MTTDAEPFRASRRPEVDLDPLRVFGAEAHRLEFPSIAEGGFVISGQGAAFTFIPGKEESNRDQRKPAGKEAGSTTGSWQGPSAQAAAPRAPAHAVEPGRSITSKTLVDELRDYGADVSVVRSSERFAYLRLPVGLFSRLPYRAELLLEVPLIPRAALRRGLPDAGGIVPDVRVWSRWTAGQALNGLIKSHHGYPDKSMCVCMTDQWRLGRDALIAYVDYGILWIAKVLHEQLVGFYPGQQHYAEKVRVERDRVDEFCGCGSVLPYAKCHRASDLRMTSLQRADRHYSAQRAYVSELAQQDRPTTLPVSFG